MEKLYVLYASSAWSIFFLWGLTKLDGIILQIFLYIIFLKGLTNFKVDYYILHPKPSDFDSI